MSALIFIALLGFMGALTAVIINNDRRKHRDTGAANGQPTARIDRKELAWASAIILVVVIGGLFASSSYRFKNAENPNEIFAQKALQAARDTMMDPTTVKFKNVTVNSTGNCMYGQILAKNAMGAYTGYRDFVWINRRLFISYADQASPYSTAKDINDFADYMEAHGKCLAAKIDSDRLPLTIPEA